MTENTTELSAGTMLVANGTLLPPSWRLADESVSSGWQRLASSSHTLQFESALTAAGWALFFMAGGVTVHAFGLTQEKGIETALARAIAAAKQQSCNCLEILSVKTRSILRLQSVNITARPRHIQKGIFFSGRG